MAHKLLFPTIVDPRKRPSKDTLDRAGLPATACIVWGDMGPSFQTKTQEEVDDGRSHVFSASLPYPNRIHMDGKLRKALQLLRRHNLLNAIPSLEDIEGGINRPAFGDCAEHVPFTL